MRTLPAFINENGDMSIHVREGGVAVFVFEDEAGNPRDMTNASVYFEIKGFRRKLTAGDQPNQLILTIQRSDLNAFQNQRNQFLVLDETGTVPHVIMDGNIIVRGWTT